MPMDFFRRPQLAGVNLKRLSAAAIRGSARRADADMTSLVPYFPSLVAGETLNVEVDGSPYAVSVSGSGFADVLSDINTAIGPAGVAYDDDGVIGIRTATPGGVGSVQVVGGTGAEKMGFDYLTNRFRSVGGDLPSSPEGRVSNPFGASFASKGENLTVESVARSLGRLSANMDVLFSEHVREDSVLASNITVTVDATRQFLTINPSTTKVFTGLGFLTNSSTKEELVPFFQVIDSVTKQPSNSKVIAVVRGSPAGTAPFANATAWSGVGSDGNILGQDLIKVSTAISAIKNGKYVTCSGGSFISNGVQVGDYVEISGSTNLNPWTNNGYRWAVEEVVNATTLALRPLSKSELSILSVTVNDEQPVVELNETKTGLEVFGNLIVRTGSYSSGIKLFVDPPLAPNSSVEVWVAQPRTFRDSSLSSRTSGLSPALRDFVSDEVPVADGLTEIPSVILGGGNVTVGAFRARHQGKVIYIPSQVLAPADFEEAATTLNFIYWDESDGLVKVTRSPVKVFGTDTAYAAAELDPLFGSDTPARNHIIAQVTKSSGALSNLVVCPRRKFDETVQTLTVGTGAQFTDLKAAIEHVNAWSEGQGEVWNGQLGAGGYTDTSYPHFEIVLTDKQRINEELTIKVPGLRIRGVVPGMPLSFGSALTTGTACFNVSATGGHFVFEDIDLESHGSIGDADFLKVLNSATARVSFKNVNCTGFVCDYLVSSHATSSASIVEVSECSLMTATGIVKSPSTHVRLLDSYINLPSGLTVPVLFRSQSSTALYSSMKTLKIRNCEFYGDYSQVATPILFDASSSTANILVDGCSFERQYGYRPTDGTNTVLMTAVGDNATNSMVVKDCVVGTGVIHIALKDGGKNSYVENCQFNDIKINGNSVHAVQCGYAHNNYLGVTDSNTGTNNGGIGLQVHMSAVGNRITGTLRYGIISIGSGFEIAEISGNYVQLNPGGHSGVVQSHIKNSNTNGGSIHSNYVYGTGTRYIDAGTSGDVRIFSNRISMTGVADGIYLDSAIPKATVFGNTILLEFSYSSYTGARGIAHVSSGTFGNASISGNVIKSEAANSGNYGIYSTAPAIIENNISQMYELSSAGVSAMGSDPTRCSLYANNTLDFGQHSVLGNRLIGKVYIGQKSTSPSAAFGQDRKVTSLSRNTVWGDFAVVNNSGTGYSILRLEDNVFGLSDVSIAPRTIALTTGMYIYNVVNNTFLKCDVTTSNGVFRGNYCTTKELSGGSGSITWAPLAAVSPAETYATTGLEFSDNYVSANSGVTTLGTSAGTGPGYSIGKFSNNTLLSGLYINYADFTETSYSHLIFNCNYISSVSDSGNGNYLNSLWRSNRITGSFVLGNQSLKEFIGNRFDSTFSCQCSQTGNNIFKDNYVAGSAAFDTTSTANFQMVGNWFASTFGLTGHGGILYFSASRCDGTFIVDGVDLALENNHILGTSTVTNGSLLSVSNSFLAAANLTATDSITIAGSRFTSNLATYTAESESISDSYIAGNFNFTGTASTSKFRFSNNHVGGNFDSYNSILPKEAFVLNNYFDSSSSLTLNVSGIRSSFEGNRILYTDGSAVTIYASIIFFNNNCIATVDDYVAIQNSFVKFTYSIQNQFVAASGNFILGRVYNDTGITQLELLNNYVHSYADYSTILISGNLGLRCLIQGNKINQDDSYLTNASNSCIRVTGNATRLNIQNNSLSKVLAPFLSFTGPHAYGVIQVDGHSNYNIVSGNQIDKPTSAICNGFLQDINYVSYGSNSTNSVTTGNLLSADGTVGASPVHQGGAQAFAAGPAVYTVVE